MTSEDPYSPGYTPPFEGPDDALGDVGSGSEFGADLYVLYAAGRVHLPEVARTYSGLATDMHQAQAYIARCADSVEGSLNGAKEVGEDLRVAFITTTNRLNDAAEALVQIADDYVRTDEDAREEFRDFQKDLGTGYERDKMSRPHRPVPEPPGIREELPDIGPSPHGTQDDRD